MGFSFAGRLTVFLAQPYAQQDRGLLERGGAHGVPGQVGQGDDPVRLPALRGALTTCSLEFNPIYNLFLLKPFSRNVREEGTCSQS